MDGGGGIVGCDGVEAEAEGKAEGVVLLFFLGLELLFVVWALPMCAVEPSSADTCLVDSMSLISVNGRIMPYNWVMKSLRSMFSASPEI